MVDNFYLHWFQILNFLLIFIFLKLHMNKQHTDKAGIEKYKNIFFYIFVLQILWAIFGNIFFK